jgi:hypothetical protein
MRSVRSGLLAVFMVATVACAAAPSASDQARAWFIRAIDRMLVLQSVHLHAVLDGASGLSGGVDGGSGDVDLDVAHTSAHAIGRSSDATAHPVEIVVKDGVWSIDTGGGFVTEGSEAVPVPAGDGVRTAIASFATDVRLQITSADVSCAGATCHRLTAVVPAAVTWERLAPIARTYIGLPDQEPANLPAAQVIIDADTITFDPIRVDVRITLDGRPVHLVVDGSRFDQPVTIAAPAG